MATRTTDHPVPWRADDTRIFDSGGAKVGSVCHPEDASRIVAAVNAVVSGMRITLNDQEVQRRVIADLEEQVPGMTELIDQWKRTKPQ